VPPGGLGDNPEVEANLREIALRGEDETWREWARRELALVGRE
jgi:hypothetical protein